MNYYIGMHGTFDHKKYERDYYDKIKGIEFCSLTSQTEVNQVIEKSKMDGFKIGVHFPFNKNHYKYRDPQIMSPSESEREEAYEAINREVDLASKADAEYLLLHFPKPAFISKNPKWEALNLREIDYIYDDKINFKDFKELAESAFERLNNLSLDYKIPIVLELELLNKWLYKTDVLKELLDKYDKIKLCLDTSRLHVVDQMEDEFDLHDFVKKMAPYTSNLHVANIQVDKTLRNGHHPALPSLSLQDKWCDVEGLLSHVKPKEPLKSVLFEHRSDILTNDELDTCYNWIHSILNRD